MRFICIVKLCSWRTIDIWEWKPTHGMCQLKILLSLPNGPNSFLMTTTITTIISISTINSINRNTNNNRRNTKASISNADSRNFGTAKLRKLGLFVGSQVVKTWIGKMEIMNFDFWFFANSSWWNLRLLLLVDHIWGIRHLRMLFFVCIFNFGCVWYDEIKSMFIENNKIW